MLRVKLAGKDGEAKELEFFKNEVTVGRLSGNDIVLPQGNVSKHHSRIILREGRSIIVDMKSTNGTYVNGSRVTAPQEIRPLDQVLIGDFVLKIEPIASSEGLSAKDDEISSVTRIGPRAALEVVPSIEPEPESESESSVGEIQTSDIEPPPELAEKAAAEPEDTPLPVPLQDLAEPDAAQGSQSERGDEVWQASDPSDAGIEGEPPLPEAVPAEGPARSALREEIHAELLERLDLRRLQMDELADDVLRERIELDVRKVVAGRAQTGTLPEGIDPEALVQEVLDEALGLGPLEALLQDDGVTEVMVNGARQIYVEREGKLFPVDRSFSSDRAVLAVIERIVAPLGRRIDESSPWVDARLKDGSRVNAIIPPLSLKGPCLTIRKFKRDVLSLEQLVAGGAMSAAAAELLSLAVRFRRNILVSGGTGSGKTTLLNALGALVGPDERIITIEDAAELRLTQAHWIPLEARPANVEGRGEVTIRELVKNALRMRPDRILVGECRSGEALDMLQAMNTGHDGSITTLHANSPRDALARLETMVLMAGLELPSRAIREQAASAVHLIVQQARFPDGRRRVTQVTEVTGMEGDQITLQDLFVFQGDPSGTGRLRPTGLVPRFFEQLRERGASLQDQLSLFQEG